MHTASGKWIDIQQLSPADVDLQDIAHSLAGIIRWGGATTRYITVEDHLLFCDDLVQIAAKRIQGGCVDDAETAPKCNCNCVELVRRFPISARMRLLILLHDAHECYLGDVRHPTAVALQIDGLLKQLKLSIDKVIWKALGIEGPSMLESELIHEVDLWSRRLEALWYMPEMAFHGINAIPPISAEDEPDCVGIETHVRIHPPGSTWLNRVRSLLHDLNL